ncbi:MAG TPA: malto-oligosyltrehalose trehalohydrolase [Thermodesulfobacteriota bacterium]|nr:malto-oligosyltrehalose trehalohydrolase [Deltaproteobacteria bacterium]HNU71216.1 malto-oligosyltrehalose trehalohydrolase [Thermodesulfobacteriota bacterium]
MRRYPLGATWLGEGQCAFCVWGPKLQELEVHVCAPEQRTFPLIKQNNGYFSGVIENITPGSRYVFVLDDSRERPDPASRYQPDGVHEASAVIDPTFEWTDGFWYGIPLRDYILYELHVGTYTSEGTFAAIIPHLGELRDMGITALELMPVAQFPGSRNWGYDGVYPFAVQNSYGGPEGLKTLVNACHQNGLAVVLDVVYNHFGPEGNYLSEFGYYFTDRYTTPWGEAINFDGPFSDHVRRYFLENALYWVSEFHVDALRLDAVHAILDFAAQPFLQQLSETIHDYAERINRRIYLIPESDLNDTRLIRCRELGGFGMDAQWNDDFHHALHALMTNERDGYYCGYGQIQDLAKAYREGFVYSGQYSPYRKRNYGTSSEAIPGHQLIIFSQNHDQIGNRMLGERLSSLVSLEAQKLAAGLVLLAPYLPLLFMGEEYGERAPFQYFVSAGDPELAKAVAEGRKQEFAEFAKGIEPPDPQAKETFLACKLDHACKEKEEHQLIYDLYRILIQMRTAIPCLRSLDKEKMEVLSFPADQTLMVRRWTGASEALILFHCGDNRVLLNIGFPEGYWEKLIDTSETQWHGPGSLIPEVIQGGEDTELTLSPWSFCVLIQSEEDDNV